MEASTLIQPRLFGETHSIHRLCDSRFPSVSVHPPRPHGGPFFPPEEPLRNVESLIATAAHQTQLNPFNFKAYPDRNSITDVATFSGLYARQRYLTRLTPSTQNGRIRSHSPVVKNEALGTCIETGNINKASAGSRPEDVSFGTEVDTLMKAIQAKPQPAKEATGSLFGIGPVVRIATT